MNRKIYILMDADVGGQISREHSFFSVSSITLDRTKEVLKEFYSKLK